MSRDEFLWCEKYRPKTIDECVLPQQLKDTFKEYIKNGQLPNFIFSGSAGVGKTTVARALCNELGADYLFINGSEERGIDVLRTKIKSFASSVSLTEAGAKVVILDEADYLTPDTQAALRAFIEEFSNNCRFILTCNFKNRIITPLHSRCSVVEFRIESAEKPKIAANFFRRIVDILNAESVKSDNKVVAKVVETFFPDFRRVLNELQRYSVGGRIDTGILANLSDESMKELLGYLKSKDFMKARMWVAKNNDIETSVLFRRLYDTAADFLEQSSIPELVLTLADYQYKAAFVADIEVNNVAALMEIMANCKFK
jgi:DNA polymerase III delta prime subunit